jgi:addiction module RelE/StbE family toxin
MVKVIWTDSAIQDLNDIGDFIARDSQRYAELTVEKLFYSVDLLEEHPRLGKMVPEFEDDSIRELIRGSYRIVYHIVDDFRIDILTVHNCARLIENAYDFSDFEE